MSQESDAVISTSEVPSLQAKAIDWWNLFCVIKLQIEVVDGCAVNVAVNVAVREYSLSGLLNKNERETDSWNKPGVNLKEFWNKKKKRGMMMKEDQNWCKSGMRFWQKQSSSS